MSAQLYFANNDGLVSQDGSNPISINLFSDLNEEKEVRLYVQTESGYAINGLEIVPTGITANKWSLALDNGGVVGAYETYGNPLLIGDTNDRVYFWARAKATDDETPTSDSSVSLDLMGLPAIFIANLSLTYTATDSTYTVNFNPVQDRTGLEYFLVEGTVGQINDSYLIQQLPVVASGTDVSQLSGIGSPGEAHNVNIYVKDQTGTVSLYTSIQVILDEPLVESIEVTEDGVDVTGGIDLNKGESTQLLITVHTIESTNTDYTTQILNTAVATIDSNNVLTEISPGTTTLIITASLNGAQIEIPLEVIADEISNDSPIIEINT